MKGILADISAEGQVRLLHRLMSQGELNELWFSLGLPVLALSDVGLPDYAPDALVWELCQQRQLVLVTANRNKLGDDSLEATILQRNALQSLPVITIADAERVRHEGDYARRAAEQLLEYLFFIDQHLGAGRLFVP